MLRRKPGLEERLVLLSLALESAVQDENWQEVSSLFANREALIAEAEATGGLSSEAVSRAQEVEARVRRLLKDRREAVIQGMRDRSTERTANAAYRSTGSLQGLDRVG